MRRRSPPLYADGVVIVDRLASSDLMDRIAGELGPTWRRRRRLGPTTSAVASAPGAAVD